MFSTVCDMKSEPVQQLRLHVHLNKVTVSIGILFISEKKKVDVLILQKIRFEEENV